MSGEPLVIALDLDGTIEDSRPDMVSAVQRVRTTLGGAPRNNNDIVPHVSRGMAHLYRTCFDDILDGAEEGSAEWAKVRRAYEHDYLTNICVDTRMYDGMEPVLFELSELTPLCLVTNKPEAHSRALLTALSIDRYFAEVIGGDTTKEEKPSPLPLIEAANRRGVDLPGDPNVFLIGDSAGDVRTARSAGARSIHCAWGYHGATLDEEPDFVAARPSDLVHLIERERS